MDFLDVASFFDDDPVYDAYSGALLFYCHTTPHDDQTSSGATARRRTMTTIDNTQAPPRAAVRVHDDFWLVSDSNPDGFRGDNIRRSYSLKKSTGLMTALTGAEAAHGAAGVELHAQKEYFRDMQNQRTESDWDVMWNIFCARGEPVSKGRFLRQDGVIFRVRNAYDSVDGYRIAEVDQLDDDALQSATFATGVLDLVTDQVTDASVVAPVIQTDPQKYYQFRTQAESMLQPGDLTVFVAKADLAPRVGGMFRMLDADWQIKSKVSEGDTWALLARLV